VDYGNRFLNISQTFLLVLTEKKVRNFEKYLEKKKGICKIMENTNNKQAGMICL